MKSKVLFGVFTVLVLTLIVVMIVKDETETKIIINPQYISMYHTDDYETFHISLLTTTPNISHFNEENVMFSSVENDTESMSLNLVDISSYGDGYDYLDDEYYVVDFEFQLPISMKDTEIKMSDCHINLSYANGDTLNLFIGEFNYLFKPQVKNSMVLGNFSATYGYVNEIETVTGINITLSNISDQNITIKSIDLLSSDIHLNFGKSLEMEECYYKSDVTECIGVDDYNFDELLVNQKSYLLRTNNSIDLYIPMVYQNESSFIYRFPIIITYLEGGEEYQYVIDDFPFMTKGIYLEEMEGDYREATIFESD